VYALFVQHTKWWLVDFSVFNIELSRFLVCRILSSWNYPFCLLSSHTSLAVSSVWSVVSRWIIYVVDRFPDCANVLHLTSLHACCFIGFLDGQTLFLFFTSKFTAKLLFSPFLFLFYPSLSSFYFCGFNLVCLDVLHLFSSEFFVYLLIRTSSSQRYYRHLPASCVIVGS